MAPRPYQIRALLRTVSDTRSSNRNRKSGEIFPGDLAKLSLFPERNILENLNEENRKLFLSRCSRERYKSGAPLFMAGQRHRMTFFVESGLVRIFHLLISGKELTIGYRSKNDIIGGPYFFDDRGIHVWSASAVEPSVMLSISGRDLQDLITSVPAIGKAVLDAITFRWLWDSLLIQVLGTGSVSSRLAHLLHKLVMFYGIPEDDEIVVTHFFTQEDLGNMVGATRPWISVQLKRFQDAGIIQVRNRQIIIQDLSRLAEMCE